jgi:hypothetical protein
MEIAETLRCAESNQLRGLHGDAALTKKPGSFPHCGENRIRRPAAAIEDGERQPQVTRVWHYAVFYRNLPPLEKRDRFLRLCGTHRKE